jgi:hypothetical protein
MGLIKGSLLQRRILFSASEKYMDIVRCWTNLDMQQATDNFESIKLKQKTGKPPKSAKKELNSNNCQLSESGMMTKF